MTRAQREAELLESVRAQPVPEHVAIIMDGNGRWATRRGMPRVAGHHEGVKTARAMVRAADTLSLRYLTLYAFSTENGSRRADEVSGLMRLLGRAIDSELRELMGRVGRLRVHVRAMRVLAGVCRMINHQVREARMTPGLNVLVLFNCGGGHELIDA